MLEDVERRRLVLPEAGVEIALLDWGGDGPLALLHHANGFCAALWAPVAEGLRRHFRVVAMDARGHGDSSKPDPEKPGAYAWHRFGEDARAVARELAVDARDGRIALALGHSFGGTALMAAAAEDPALFSRLVMVDPVLHPPPERRVDPERAGRGAELMERARKRRNVFDSRDEAAGSWREKPLFAGWTEHAFRIYLDEGLADRPDGRVELKCPSVVEAAIFAAGVDFDAWEVASRVRTPALILWAQRGDFPRSAHEGIAARMADAEVRDVPTGHLVPMERPDLVCDAVLDFAGPELR